MSVGAGAAATPYAVPAEVHGGVSYTKSLGAVNITQAVKETYNVLYTNARSTYSSMQKQLNYAKKTLRRIINQRSRRSTP